MTDLFHRKTCRICGSRDLVKVLDLGKMPPANAFLRKADFQKEKKFPLVLYFCRNCGLVQLLDVVNPAILFKDYDYLTSASKPLVDHFVNEAEEISKKLKLKKTDLAIDIGGNDGVLLGALKEHSRVLNIDPSNVALIARRKGIETVNDFFTEKLSQNIFRKFGTARVIFANNVMAHIDDIHDVFRGVRNLIGENGIFVFEAHWVGNLIGEGGFDQIYHEHLCYYSLSALKHLTDQLGLVILDVETVPIHGESLRVYVAKNKRPTKRTLDFYKKEKRLGLLREKTFHKFAKRVFQNKKDMAALLQKIKKEKRMIAGYGAPAKGNTLLNFFRIGPRDLTFITDTTPLKQGLYSPGMHIPVVPPSRLNSETPDYLLLLAWNYADAILKKEALLREKGAKFIIPEPKVKIV